MNFLPLWTAIVWPTISGVMVERRDQVLITVRLPLALTERIRRSRWSSRKKPFLIDLAIVRLLLVAPLDDESLRALVVPSLEALGRKPPRAYRMPAARGLALAAAVRMVDRVHRHAADRGPAAQPARAAGLADRDV